MTSVPDPGSGALLSFFDPLTPGSMGWKKNPDPGSKMSIPDHISESLVTIFLVTKILKFFDADPDPGSF